MCLKTFWFIDPVTDIIGSKNPFPLCNLLFVFIHYLLFIFWIGAFLDHNHTHFLLVDNGTEGKYGVEIPFRSALEAHMVKG